MGESRADPKLTKIVTTYSVDMRLDDILLGWDVEGVWLSSLPAEVITALKRESEYEELIKKATVTMRVKEIAIDMANQNV